MTEDLDDRAPSIFLATPIQHSASTRGAERQRYSLSQFILSLFKGVGQLLPGDLANVILAAGEFSFKKVPHRFSESEQGERTWVTGGLDDRGLC